MIVKVEDFRRTGETGISPARGASRFRRLAECHRNYRRRAIAPIPALFFIEFSQFYINFVEFRCSKGINFL